MEQQNSIKGELNTLIMLEQQQTEALQALNSKGGFAPTQAQVGNFGASYYNPNVGGFQAVPGFRGVSGGGYSSVATNYLNEVGAAMGYAQNLVPPQVRNMQSRARNAMLNADMESMSPFWANQSKINAQTQEQLGANLGAKFTAGTLSAASSLSGFAGNAIGSALGGGFLGSLALGGIAGVAVGGTIDIMADQMKQNYAYDRYLQQNSYRFINMGESNNDRGPAGFNRKERWDAANWLRHMGTSMKISDNDTMMLLQNFTEGDLLRQVKDMETFQEQMTKMTKAAKTMALSLNTTLEEASKMMEELKAKGINTRNYESLGAGAKIVGAMTGQEASDVLDFTTNTAQNIVAGTGIDINSVQSGVSMMHAYMGKIHSDAEQSGNQKLLSYIYNYGGAEGATSNLMGAYVNAMKDESGTFRLMTAAAMESGPNGAYLNASKVQKYSEALKNGTMDLAQLANLGTQNLHGLGFSGMGDFIQNGGELAVEAITSNPYLTASWFEGIGSAASRMSGLSVQAALETALGLGHNDANIIANLGGAISGVGPDYMNQIRYATMAQTVVDKSNSMRAGFGYEVKNAWGGFKDFVGDVVSPFAEGWNRMGQGISDWWYGREYTNAQELWQGIDWENRPLADAEGTMTALYQAFQGAGLEEKANELLNPMEELKKAIGGLTGDIDTNAKKIREASQKLNVTERDIIGWIQSNKPKTIDEVLGGIQGISESRGGDADLYSRAFATGPSYDNLDKMWEESWDRAYNDKVEALKVEMGMKHVGWSPEFGSYADENLVNYQAGYFNAAMGLGIDNTVGKADGMYQGYYDDYLLHDVDRGIIAYNQDTIDMLTEWENASEEDKANTAWGLMSVQEKQHRIDNATRSEEYFTNRGYSADSKEKGYLFEDINTIKKKAKNGGFMSDDEQDFLNRVYVSGFDEDGNAIYDVAAEGQDVEKLKEEVYNEYVEKYGQEVYDRYSGRYVTGLDGVHSERAAKLKGDVDKKDAIAYLATHKPESLMGNEELLVQGFSELSINEMMEKTEAAINEFVNSKEYKTAQNNFTKEEDWFNSNKASDENVQKIYGLLRAGDYESAKQAAAGTNNKTLIEHTNSYAAAKETVDKNNQYVKTIYGVHDEGSRAKQSAGAMESAYVTLSRAVGGDDGGFFGKNDEHKIQDHFKKVEKGKASVEDVYDAANALIADDIFEGVEGKTVTEANREHIASTIVTNLTKNGAFDSEYAQILVDNLMNSIGDGGSLNDEKQNQFVEDVVKNVAGNGGKKSQEDRVRSIDEHVASIDKTLAAIANHEGVKNKDSADGKFSGDIITGTGVVGDASGPTVQNSTRGGRSAYNSASGMGVGATTAPAYVY